nr:hypothetical protein [Tanacetum cinerariifolium]
MKSHEMRETKAYKTYLGYAIGVTPPKKAQKFKKPTSPKLSTTSSSEEPTQKSNRVKRHAKKSFDAPTTSVVIQETPVKSLSKKKETMTVEKRKGIDLLSKVTLTKEAKYEEVKKESLMNFHKNHLSGSGTVTKTPPSAAKIKSSVTDEGTGVKPGVLDVTEEESTKRENEEEIEDDEEEEEEEFVKTPSNDTDDEDETKIKDKDEGDEDEGMDYTTNQFDDDVDLRMNEPFTTDKGLIQKEDKHLNSRIRATRDEFMSYLSASITTRITKQVKSQLPQILLKEVSNFAPSVIKSIVTELLEHAVLAKESSQLKSTYEATSLLTEFELKKILIDKMDENQSYLTAPEHRECYDGLIKSYDLDKSLFSTYDKVYSLKRSQKDKDKDEDPSAGLDQGLKKRKTSKDAEPTKEFEVADSDMPQEQEENPGNNDEVPKGKVASKCDWFTKPKWPQEPTDPDWNNGKTPQQGPTQS